MENKVEYVKSRLETWNDDRSSTYWDIFDSYAMITGEDEWDAAIGKLPATIRPLVQQHGCACNLDFDYWGSPSFFGCSFDKEHMNQEEEDVIDEFLEEDEKTYMGFLGTIEELLWKETQQDEYFEAFKEVLGL